MPFIELRVWRARCDRCGTQSPPVFDPGRPDLPDGWRWVTRHRELDDAYAPSTYRVLLCPACIAKEGEPCRA